MADVATRARGGTLTWYLLLILVASVGLDVATPERAGAFHVLTGAPSDVIDAPSKSMVPTAMAAAALRPLALAAPALDDGTRIGAARHRRPGRPRAVRRLARAAEPHQSSNTATPDDD
jgi:hypothetical protein